MMPDDDAPPPGDDEAPGGPIRQRPPRVAPHNMAAEESLLGAMLLARQAIADVRAKVAPEWFYKPAHGHVCHAIYTLFDKAEPADPITVADQLTRDGLLETIGGPGALAGLQANAPAISAAGRYGDIIAELAIYRTMIGVAGEAAELAYSQPEDPDKALGQFEQWVKELRARRSRAHRRSRPARPGLEAALNRMEARVEGQIDGTPSGFDGVRALVGGYHRGGMTIIGARPAMSKTGFALSEAAYISTHVGPVAFFSLEQPEADLWERIIASEGRVNYTRIQRGQCNAEDWARITEATGRMADARMWVCDDPSIDVAGIAAECEAIRREAGEDLAAVFIDYLGLVTPVSYADTREQQVASVSRGLTILARELEVPVIAVAQVNRGVEQRADKRPGPGDLRDSGQLEQDAWMIVLLYRDEEYNRDSQDRGTGEVIIGKNRSGPTGMARLAWIGQWVKWANMASASLPPPREPQPEWSQEEML